MTQELENWKEIAGAAQRMARLRRFKKAQKAITNGLETFPRNAHLLSVASDISRATGSYKRSLSFANQLICHHPSNWVGYARAAQDLASLKRFNKASQTVGRGLRKFPNQALLLSIASDICRSAGNYSESLSHSNQLIQHHPESWEGYARAAQDLASLRRLKKARRMVDRGLKAAPYQAQLLNIASDIYRASGNHKKSLRYASLLIYHHPDNWEGYARAAQDLASLRQFKKAAKIADDGLQLSPGRASLLTIASDISRAAGDHQRSLHYNSQLSQEDTGNTDAYARIAQDLCNLKQLTKANLILDEALQKDLHSPQVLHASIELSKSLGNLQGIRHTAEVLAIDQPHNPLGYTELVKLMLAHKGLAAGKEMIKEAHLMCPAKGIFLHGARLAEKNNYKRLWVGSFAISSNPCVVSHRFTHQPFQYWSQGTLPHELQAVKEFWNIALRKIGLPPIELFDKRDALEWIRARAPYALQAFVTAPHYAAESDIFRILYALHNDSIWIDCDQFPTQHTVPEISEKLAHSDTTLYFDEDRPYLFNGFFATKRNSPFFARLAERLQGYSFSGRTINQRLIEDSFGPRAFSEALNHIANEEGAQLCKSKYSESIDLSLQDDWTISFCSSHCFCKAVPPWKLAYKESNDSWQSYLQNKGCILR